jgi:glycosyltransferase involved in cell wall biosynthesis
MAVPVLFAHWGNEGVRGSERVLLDLFSNLNRDRFAPLLWCNAKTMAAAAESLGVPARVSRMPILLGWDAPKLDVSAYRALVREGESLIREHGAKLVHANSGAPSQWLVPAARRARVPLVAHLHAIYGFRERCTLLLHQVPLVVGCSEAVVKPFRSDGFPDSRLRVIHNGVDPERLNSGEARGLRHSLGLTDGSLLIVGVGALVRLKGFDVLVRALGLLRATGVDAHLAIAGEGPERAALEALARELAVDRFVHFLGETRNVGAIFRDAADIVAISSRVESFGLVAAEAGALGLPTVASRVGGLGEVVKDGVTGLLVPAGDHASFAAALGRLARDPLLRQSLGAAARSYVLTHFTAERATRTFESLYADLIARPDSAYGWSHLGFRVAPFARLGVAVVGRRLGVRVADA